MFVSEMMEKCGLDQWETNSRIIHATAPASSPLGPYIYEDMVFPPFAHNPRVLYDPIEKMWVMWFIGTELNSTLIVNCTHGKPPSTQEASCTLTRQNRRRRSGDHLGELPTSSIINVAYSPSLQGPWTIIPKVFVGRSAPYWDEILTNPGPLILKNGTVLMTYRAISSLTIENLERIGITSAPSWRVYIVTTAPVLLPFHQSSHDP
jgi:hypothetical protein